MGGGGGSGTCCREHARGWMADWLPPVPLLLSLGDAPPPLLLTRSMFHVHDARTRFDGSKKKKSRRRRRARALYSPLKASLCVSRSQAASSFSITKGGGEERGEEDKIKGGGDELKLRQLDERSGRKGRSKTKMEDHIQHSVGWI